MKKTKDMDDEISRQARDDDKGEALSEKELKKLKQKESSEKRKNAKKRDKVARWGGLILLGLIMFIGFLLWVSGEMRSDPPLSRQGGTTEGRGGSVIVK
jgi:hypothetical protein